MQQAKDQPGDGPPGREQVGSEQVGAQVGGEQGGAREWARLDLDRAERTGDPEVVFGESKTPAQIITLLGQLAERHPDRAVLATRLSGEARERLTSALPQSRLDDVARTATIGPLPAAAGLVAIVCAGTTDLPVAREAARTVEVYGATPTLIADVGVAGLHRIVAAQSEFADADALIVIAGMEGALPSVVGGLTGIPLVAVPTSIGYGASFGGVAALLGMLNSCAPGVVVSNIDNGYGAGVHAARIARAVGLARRAAAVPPESIGPSGPSREQP